MQWAFKMLANCINKLWKVPLTWNMCHLLNSYSCASADIGLKATSETSGNFFQAPDHVNINFWKCLSKCISLQEILKKH